MAFNFNKFRDQIRQKAASNKKIFNEFNVQDLESFNKLSDTELEQLLSPKLFGLLSLRKEDFKI